jgi:hypothetical protein
VADRAAPACSRPSSRRPPAGARRRSSLRNRYGANACEGGMRVMVSVAEREERGAARESVGGARGSAARRRRFPRRRRLREEPRGRASHAPREPRPCARGRAGLAKGGRRGPGRRRGAGTALSPEVDLLSRLDIYGARLGGDAARILRHRRRALNCDGFGLYSTLLPLFLRQTLAQSQQLRKVPAESLARRPIPSPAKLKKGASRFASSSSRP